MVRFAILALFAGLFAPARSQTLISNGQYWFNGQYASAVPLGFTEQGNIDFSGAVSTAGLYPGVNILSFRVQDTEGVYSPVYNRSFFVIPPDDATPDATITGYSYWFNDAVETAQSFSFTGTTPYSLSAAIPAEELPVGLNRLNVRFVDSYDRHSSVVSKLFFRTGASETGADVVGWEYALNDGAASYTALTDPVQTLMVAEAIDLSGLYNGVNQFRFRAKDENGRYSPWLSKLVFKAFDPAISGEGNLVSVEWWWDGDYSSVTTQSVDEQEALIWMDELTPNVLGYGAHTLSYRIQDAAGRFSPVKKHHFYLINPDESGINESTAVEFWIDDSYVDAQLIENGIAFPDVAFEADMTGMWSGDHVFSMRTRDARGRWSPVVQSDFFKELLTIAGFDASPSYEDCDSTVFAFSNQSIDADSFAWDFGDGNTSSEVNPEHTFFEAGAYTVQLSATDTETGSNAVTFFDVTVIGNTFGEQSSVACDEFIFPDTGESYATSGMYEVAIPNQYGCDSLIALNLTIHPSIALDESLIACAGESIVLPDGSTVSDLSESFEYLSTLATVNGCDSTITTSVEVIVLDPSVTFDAEALSLQSLQPDANYQWLECTDMTPVPGETGNTFFPSENGNYAVEVSLTDCFVTSDCYEVIVIGVDDSTAAGFQAYPNPASDWFTVELSHTSVVTIVDSAGKTVYTQVIQPGQRRIDVEHLTAGVYFVFAESELGRSAVQLVVH